MCANCHAIGLKIDGDKLITVYSPAPAAEMFTDVGRPGGHPPDTCYDDGVSDWNYSRTKADQ